MADDDLLSPDEIEKLLRQAGQGSPSGGAPSGGSAPSGGGPPTGGKPAAPSQPPAVSPSGSGGDDDVLDPSEIERLLRQRDENAQSGSAAQSSEQLLGAAQSGVQAALSSSIGSTGPDASAATPFEFAPFDEAGGMSEDEAAALETLQDVELNLRVELGRTELLIDEVLRLREGSVVPLDKLAGDPVDILVNGRLVARGEVLVLNDNFCVRVAEILTPEL